MSNTIRSIGRAVGLPRDPVATDDHSVRNTYSTGNPYLNAFMDGLRIGFFKPLNILLSIAGCGPGSSLENVPMGDVAELLLDTPSTQADAATDAKADTASKDSSVEASGDAGVGVEADSGAEVAQDIVDAAVETTADAGSEVAPEATPEMSQEVTQEVEPETIPDVVENEMDAISGVETEVTPEVAPEVAQEVAPDVGPEVAPDVVSQDVAEETADAMIDSAMDAMTDAVLPDTPTIDIPEDATNVCQYFCDAGDSEADVGLPADATATDVGLPGEVTPTTVFSYMCGPISAPQNSVAAACSNSVINALLLGATGCVAECGFFDNNVLLSSDPNNPVPFAMNLFAPPADPQLAITLSLKGPVLSDGSSPGLPGFLGSSFVFAFDKKTYDEIDNSNAQWEAKDTDGNGNLKGTVRILYQPLNYVFTDNSEFLEITYEAATGEKMAYRYPCDTLPNPQVQCTEVK